MEIRANRQSQRIGRAGKGRRVDSNNALWRDFPLGVVFPGINVPLRKVIVLVLF